MTSTIPTITKVKFDEKGLFSVLEVLDWMPGFSPVSINDLIVDGFGDDSNHLLMFLTACSGEVNLSNVLSVKASPEGIVERVYGPVLQASEDEKDIVIRSGGNTFTVKQNGRNFQVGELEGELESYDITIRKGTPDEQTISIPRIDFSHKENPTLIFSIRVLIKKDADGEGLKQVARSKKPITPYLMASKSGGVDAFKLTEIPEGEYLVTDIDINTGGEYGNSYLIILGDKGVWANASLKNQLNKHYGAFKSFIANGKPVTLTLANIRELPTGYKTCSTGLFLREPRLYQPALPESVDVKPVLSGSVDVESKSDGLPF